MMIHLLAGASNRIMMPTLSCRGMRLLRDVQHRWRRVRFANLSTQASIKGIEMLLSQERIFCDKNVWNTRSGYYIYKNREVDIRTLVSKTSTQNADMSSPFNPNKPTQPSDRRRKRKSKFIPRKAAVHLTSQALKLFKALLENTTNTDTVGIMLNYNQSKTGEPRMVFSFQFVTAKDIDPDLDEGVSLEVLSDGSPKPPSESLHDGLPKLYINHNAFLKVLGCTVDVDMDTISPVLYDREGNRMDPNA